MRHKKSLLHIFQSLEMGGAQTRFMQMLQHPDAADYNHSVFALNGCYDLLDKWPKDAVHPEIFKDLIYKKGAFFKNILAFRKVFQSEKFDLIQTQNWPTIEAVIANSPQIIPHIHNEDGFGADEVQKLKIRRNVIRRIFLMGKTLLVPSMVLQKIADEFWSTSWTDIHYVPNGIISAGGDVHSKKTQRNHIVFVTVAMLRKEKNIEAMIDMVAFFKEKGKKVLLKIVGSGPEEQHLKDYAASLNLTKDYVHFLGFQSDYMRTIYSADIFLLSSRTEQQPYSILQAMSAMKPVLSTDVGDVYNMVSGDNKKYVSDNVFRAPYDLAASLMNDKKQCLKIGISNKYWQKQHYGIETSLKKRYKYINDLTK